MNKLVSIFIKLRKSITSMYFSSYTNINEIQIITNKGNIINKISDLHLNHIKYLYSHERQENETWYVIKILQDNHRIAISSPIFIE